MRPRDWDRAEDLFHRLAGLDVGARGVALAEISTEDPELGSELKALLAAHEDSGGALDRLKARFAPDPLGPAQPGEEAWSLAGTSIDHYEVGDLVGRGGMGDVYRARDTRLDREVALKFLPRWLGRDPSARDRFLLEARVVSSIDHPNVCTLLEMGETDDGRLFLIMPYYRGRTLKRRLSEEALPVEDAIDVALQTARGLAAAHERGVVHRDVKPANLLLTESGRVKILDFGVAKLADVSLTHPGQRPGTERYMAPEQASGAEVDARTDLWSLGPVLFEMLTGRRPVAPSGAEAAESALDSEALAELPRELADVVGRSLAPAPEDRYPDARALIEDLEVLARGAGTPVAGGTILDGIVGQPAKWRWPIWLVGLGGALFVGGASLTLGDRLTDRSDAVSAAEQSTSATDAGEPVAVLPFTVVGSEPGLATWHEGPVHLISHAVGSVDGLRSIDKSAIMNDWNERFGEGGTAPNMESALEIARRFGARYAIGGTAVGLGETVYLTAQVFDVDTGEQVGSAQVSSPPESIATLANRLTIDMLRDGLLPADEVQLANLAQAATRSLDAFQAFLAGEADFRRGRYWDAAAHFVNASDIDPDFAWAMYRASQAYHMTIEWGLYGEYAARAAAFADGLPTRDSLLFTNRIALNQSPTLITGLERLTNLHPDDLDGWAQLGHALWHFGGRALRPSSEYRGAWGNALEIGDIYAVHYGHPIEDLFARRDSAGARAMLDRLGQLNPDRHPCPEFEHAFAATWLDEAGIARARRRFPRPVSDFFPCAWTALAAGAATADEWEAKDRAYLRAGGLRGQGAFWRMLQARFMRGELSRARDVLALVDDVPGYREWAARYGVQFDLAGLPGFDASSGALALLERQEAVSDLINGSQTTPFWLGMWAIERENRTDVESPAAEIAIAADSIAASQPMFEEETRALAEALRLFSYMASDWPDDLTSFEEVLGRLPSMGYVKDQPDIYLRYRMGRTLFDRGALAAAERYFLTFYPFHWAYYVPAQFYLGRIYEKLEEPEKAREHYRIFVEWWKGADPELQPWVDEGRAGLARVSG